MKQFTFLRLFGYYKKIVMNVKAKWICILKYASTREITTGHSALQFFAFEINDQRLIQIKIILYRRLYDKPLLTLALVTYIRQ